MIFQNFKPREKEVEIEGQTITIRECTYPIRKQIIEARATNASSWKFAELMLLNMVYVDGQRAFKSVDDLNELPSRITDKLLEECAGLFNVVEETNIDELKKN